MDDIFTFIHQMVVLLQHVGYRTYENNAPPFRIFM